MRVLLCLLLIVISLFKGPLQAISDEERVVRCIRAHLMLRDFHAAYEEAQQALLCYPQSMALHESYIKTLAHLGSEKLMIQAWETYVERFPDQAENREIIEEMAWGVLHKASHSSSLIMREMALLAAYFSREAQGINILYQGMRDPNYAIRAVAVKLAGRLHDDKLKEEVKRLFKQEKVWSVRQRVLEAIGQMKIVSLRADLEALIASNESLAGEKALAIAALLELLDCVNRPEIERLVSSDRAGLRQLACQAIVYFQSKRDLDQLFLLTKDVHPTVRLEAFQALGQLRPRDQTEMIFSVAREGIQAMNPHVALSAAWLLTLYAPEEGQRVLEHFLSDERQEVRLLAAAALSATGHYGMPLILDQFRNHPDAYVRFNLSLGLIGQRQDVQEASVCLKEMLVTDKSKWSKVEIGLFRAIVNKPSKQANDPLNTPEMDNQVLRLELLNLLAILQASEAQQAVRDYLMERSWGISATAAALLLTEGDDSAVEIVKGLLQDSQPRVRLQAALVLSLWSREETAIHALEEGYTVGDRESKARILESLGRIGSMQSIPFLIHALKEPSQTLRLIAAMALIQCLNH